MGLRTSTLREGQASLGVKTGGKSGKVTPKAKGTLGHRKLQESAGIKGRKSLTEDVRTPPVGFPGSLSDYKAFLESSGRGKQLHESEELHEVGANQIKSLKESCDKMEAAHSEGKYGEAGKHLEEAVEKAGQYHTCLDSLASN